MSDSSTFKAAWLDDWMTSHDISLWGAADLRNFSTPKDETGNRFSFAISLVFPMNLQIMASIRNGPNRAYADEYSRVNHHINQLSTALAADIKSRGFQSNPLEASVRTDRVNVKGDFPHKTVATRAGLGWIGRHCQLITRPFGSWVRLGTVFINIELSCGTPMERNFCGSCTRCVDACPAKALSGNPWYPGVPREEILNVWACDQWKKEHYFQYHKGQNCGICSSVCPYGLKAMRRTSGKT